MDTLRECVHAHAHRCPYLHILLPARENPQRLPLLHPHHDHGYHDDHHHYHRCDDYYYDCNDYHDGCDYHIDVEWFWCFPAGYDDDYYEGVL